MIRKTIIVLCAITIFIMGSYMESIYKITPLLSAVFHTATILAADLKSFFITAQAGRMNTESAVVAVGGFLLLLLFKFFFRAGKL